MSDTPTPQVSGLLRCIAAITCIEFFETGLVMFGATHIMAGLGLSPEQFALAYTLYGVSSIYMLYKHQWMVERLGYRRFVLASLGVFALGGILAATAGGFGQFACGRLLQGASGATFFTAGRLAINRLPAEARFPGLLAFIGSLLGASAVAPVAAAVLLAAFDWRALFWAALPLCLLIARIAGPHLDQSTVPPEQRSEEHWGWLLWLVIGIFGLQYAIQEIPAAGAAAHRLVFVVGLASIAALTVFAWRQWRKERPLIDYRGLLQWRYLLGIALYFSGYFMLGAFGFLLPIFFHNGLGLSLASTAVILGLSAACSVVAAIVHAWAARRVASQRHFMLGGLGLYALACLAFSQVGRLADWPLLLLPALVCGVAVPFYIGPVAFGTFSELPACVFSHAYQVKNIVRQLGISSSIALSTAGLQHFYAAQPQGAQTEWALALHGLGSQMGGLQAPLTLAAAELFFWLAIAVLPVAALVRLQRTFR